MHLIHGHVLLAMTLLAAVPLLARGEENANAGPEFYETQVRPLLAKHCQGCHGPDEQESQLRLDSYGSIAQGGTSGPVIVPGKPNESLLISAINYADEALQMPPDGKLPAEAIAVLKQWIEQGAPHPASEEAPAPSSPHGKMDLAQARQFWAFQSIVRPAVPMAKRPGWDLNPIDAFVLADLEQTGLTPAGPATRRELIRRATFDLTGLPPTPEEVDAFVQDASPEAYPRLLDRLLDSPHYGERWGRHWLDIVRYADSNGLDENVAHGNAWRYRDYVIAAFNKDLPFDRFLLEQLAGDLLPEGPETEIERKIATGYLTLGAKVLAEQDKSKMQMDVIDEQIDSIGQAFLGLTLGCARCHDHKFDPITTADYYALAGIFQSTLTMESMDRISKWNENVIATPEQLETHKLAQAKVDLKNKEIQQVIDRTNTQLFSQTGEKAPKDAEKQYPAEVKAELKELREKLAALQKEVPELPTAMGVREAEIKNTRIHVRGSHLSLGKEIPRGVPAVLAIESVPPIASDHSGRLELAQWLIDPAHPLTARVMVNRLWRWHFGRGLVASTDNFGRLGERPVNQPLLDWLASEFMHRGWSLKQMHKLIMLSQTYQMSSRNNPANAAVDPDNHHHWRANVRRLEAEAIHDALLAVSGQLDPTAGGSLLHVANREFIFNHTSKDETRYDVFRRAVYLPVIRNNLYDGFSLFDYSDASIVQGDRNTSTIATQALYMMNSDLLLQSADALADRVLSTASADSHERVQQLYRFSLCRDPDKAEVRRLTEFVGQMTADLAQRQKDAVPDPERAAWSLACQAVLISNEFNYVD